MNRRALKSHLDALVVRYKTPAFIASDPMAFPHAFRGDPAACELVAFLAALFSYGRRELIRDAVSRILAPMAGDPPGFVRAFHPRRDRGLYAPFVYRFNRGEDVTFLIARLQEIYRDHGSLEGFFTSTGDNEAPLRDRIAGFAERFLAPAPAALRARYGMRFLFARPDKGSACKRFNMFLRWMVRDDGIDFGLWRCLRPADLIVPLDTHVAAQARRLKLIRRRTDTWQTASELTDAFRRFCPEDPVRYDFALFGLGVSGGALPEEPPDASRFLSAASPL